MSSIGFCMRQAIAMVLSDLEEDAKLETLSQTSDHRIDELREKVHEIFNIFDEEGDGCIEVADVGHVLRCLEFSPTQQQVDELCGQVPKKNDKVPFDSLLPRIVAATEGGEWRRDPPKMVIAAFGTICDSRFINKNKLIEMLTTIGEPLSAGEVKVMLNHLAIRRNGDVDWRTYVKDALDHISE